LYVGQIGDLNFSNGLLVAVDEVCECHLFSFLISNAFWTGDQQVSLVH
jgi:hypothetical protein